MTNKSVFIETYGCQMNVYDTELVKTILKKANYSFSDNEQNADVVMLNTCSVRDNANRKIYNRIHEIRRARDGKPVQIGVLGCMATNFRKKILDDKRLKIDFIAGPDSYKHLPSLIDEADQTGKAFHFSLSEYETYSDILPTRQEGLNAWIAIMRGCNNYCTFCVVPHTRGRERSRDPHNIVEEVKTLVKHGHKQVTLLGQNVNSYLNDKYDFTDLMKMVSDVEGIERIRFTSPHPKDFPRKLLHLMAERDNICKQIHLPLQAGNDRILEMMNRTYTKKEYLDLVAEIRDIMPNVALTTDIILGFPTETWTEYEDTVDVVEKVEYDSAFIFNYSERPNTLASKRYPDDVTAEEKKKRIMFINEIQRSISLRKNEAHVGQTHRILIEQLESKKNPDFVVGRNDGNKIVMVEKDGQQIGDALDAKIISAGPNSLRGTIF